MATERWQDNVHYYEYDPDSVERYFGMDAVKVAEGYVYNPSGTAAFGVIFVVSAQDLRGGVKMADAIKTARGHLHTFTRPDLAGNHFDDAKTLAENKTLLYRWNGMFVRRAL